MMLREILKPVLVEWPMSDNLGMLDYEINRLVSQLDDIAYSYEAKWGAGALEACAASTNETLAQKWQSQVDKINDAISSRDIATLRALVEGASRGYSALEENACRVALKPKNDPVIFTYHQGSTIYRVVRLVSEERAAKMPNDKNVVVLSCEEMCKRYDKGWFELLLTRDNIDPRQVVADTYSQKGPLPDDGDEIPWQ